MQTIIDVLVIDDSDPHARTTLSGIRRASETATVLRFKDGEQALQYIYSTGMFQERSRTFPRMILLDLDIPLTNGLRVLSHVREHPDTRAIPVIVLTSNRNPVVIEDAYARGARAYLIKPENKGEYISEVARVVNRWLQVPIASKAS